jgi:hypothetical protein
MQCNSNYRQEAPNIILFLSIDIYFLEKPQLIDDQSSLGKCS